MVCTTVVSAFLHPWSLLSMSNEVVLTEKILNKQPCKNTLNRTSLVAQWLRIHLPMQGTRVQALVREDPTHHRATKPMRHNY